MVRKTEIAFLIFALSILLVRVTVAYADSSVNINASNNLSIPVYEGFQFDVTLKDVPIPCQFALFEGDLKLPLQVLSQNGDTFKFSTVLSFGPSEKKNLTLKYGSNVTADNSNEMIAPDFLGNVFVGVGSGNLYISTANDESLIKVTDSSYQVLFSGTLNSNDSKIISLKNNTIFRIESSKPIFAEISSLQPDYVSNSSDDISSVYGTYFKIFIPKEIFVSSVEATSLIIKGDSGKVVYDGDLVARGTYVNMSLDSGFYTVSAEKPVLIQFGYSDDNIYTINYGAASSMKLFSFGDIGISSLYPNTVVTVKTVSDANTITLKNAGDFYNSDIIKSFLSGKTEYAPVYVTYSKPVIIYTGSNSGNIGGEQIPSLRGDGKSFSFRTGKVYDFENIRHYRQVEVVAESDGTQVELNGNKFALNALGSKTFSFNESYSLVNITSNMPLSVFEVGLGTDKEFLSMLVPLHDNTIGASAIAESSNQNSTENPGNNSLSNFFKNQISKVGVFFVNLWGTISKGDWISNLKGVFTNFWNSLKPFIHNVSVRIIEFFYPLAQTILPYAQKLFPEITNEQLSAAIFFALLLILVILIIPKRRKENKRIPTVPIGEVKKKTLDFNVKTLEEKTQTNEEISFEEKPLSISRKAQKEATTIPPESEKGFENLGVKAPKKVEIPRKEESNLKLPVLKKPQKKNLFGKGTEEPQPIVNETPLSEVNIIKEVEEKSTVGSEAREKEGLQAPDNKKPEIVERQEATVSFADFGQPSAEAMQKAKEEGIILTEPNEVIKSTAATPEEVAENPVRKEAESPFLDKLKGEIVKEAASNNIENKAPIQEMNAEQTGEEQIAEKPEQLEEKPPEIKPESEAPQEPSTIDVLLNKIKVQSDNAVPSDLIPIREETPEKTAKPIQKDKEPHETAKKIIDKSFVSDAESVSKVIDSKKYDEDDKKSILRRVYVSAQAKISLSEKLPPNFTLAVIALTPIEQRIAEDMGKRIKGKVTTGEALLIAKKIKLMDVVVSDKPSITNYQGISISNIDDIL